VALDRQWSVVRRLAMGDGQVRTERRSMPKEDEEATGDSDAYPNRSRRG
jgi:hypothetical protein